MEVCHGESLGEGLKKRDEFQKFRSFGCIDNLNGKMFFTNRSSCSFIRAARTRQQRWASFSAQSTGTKKPALGGWLWLIPVTTFGLGCWQVYRLQWKLDLIKRTEERLHLPAVPFVRNERITEHSADEYRRVFLKGTFLHDKEMHLGPRTRADNEAKGGGLVSGAMPIGYYVITPFKLEDGSVILVNRGWIPRQLEGESRRADQVEGVVTIEGVLRNGEEARIGLPANKPGEAPWIWLDVAGMSKHSGADPIFIEMMSDSDINRGLATGDYPATRRLFTNFSNNHLSYAITWYGMCIFSTVVLWRSQRRHTMVHGLRR